MAATKRTGRPPDNDKAKQAAKTAAKSGAIVSRSISISARTKSKSRNVFADVMPLDVMLGAMRELWARAEALRGRSGCEDECLALIRQASAEAHKAAVYLHPRLSSVDGAEETAAGNVKASSKSGAGQIQMLALGSRELARRLLFAVAFAEHLEPAFQPDKPEEKR